MAEIIPPLQTYLLDPRFFSFLNLNPAGPTIQDSTSSCTYTSTSSTLYWYKLSPGVPEVSGSTTEITQPEEDAGLSDMTEGWVYLVGCLHARLAAGSPPSSSSKSSSSSSSSSWVCGCTPLGRFWGYLAHRPQANN